MEWFGWFDDQSKLRTVFVLAKRVNNIHAPPPFVIGVRDTNKLVLSGANFKLVYVSVSLVSRLDERHNGGCHSLPFYTWITPGATNTGSSYV